VTMKPQDIPALIAQIQDVAGIATTDIANATQDPPELEFRAIIKDAAGVTTKTFQVDDAKWTMPALAGSVGAKTETDFAFSSASGDLNIFKGDQP
jgi:hypothetical protein